MDALILDLLRRVRDLSAYIDAQEELAPAQYAALLRLQGDLTTRVGRLLRERGRADGGAQGDADLERAMHAALDAAAAILKTEL